jgi:hypothetical protein
VNRTAAEEKRICLRLARTFLEGESAVVTAEQLARLLFDQRHAARLIGAVVETLDYDEAEVDDGV